MLNTPNGDRIHIGIFGRTNVGKSTLINALVGSDISVVSSVKGTTTDAVSKAMELIGLGPVLFFDTAGFDDNTILGEERKKATKKVVDKTDFAIIVVASNVADFESEKEFIKELKIKKIDYIVVCNEFENNENTTDLKATFGEVLYVNPKKTDDVNKLKEYLINALKDKQDLPLVAHLVKENDLVILVMPQDSEAPKGRLILPQVQTIRELLDVGAYPLSVKTSGLINCLEKLKEPPKLAITDSQAFKEVNNIINGRFPLTSFSILMSKKKGDIDTFILGAKAVNSLNEGDTVLIMEGCTHNQKDGDIARVKIPNLLQKYLGKKINFEFTAGGTIPTDFSKYKLVIHCGGCMLNRKSMLTKIEYCKNQNVPITNFGVILAFLNGILDKVVY